MGSGDFEGVEALGWVSEEEKRGLLRNSDFMLSPSEYEGSSVTVIESIANGIPCICSPTSAETIGIEDLVIDLDDPEKWAERIEELSNPASYEKILQRLEKQRGKFDLSKARENWGNLYSDVIS